MRIARSIGEGATTTPPRRVRAASTSVRRVHSLAYRRWLAGAKRALDVLEIRDHRQAVDNALSLVGPGELVVIQPEDEDIEPTLEIVRALALREATEESGCFQGIDTN